MERIFEYQISSGEEGRKLGDFLREKGYSRQLLRQLKETENGLLRNGQPTFMTIALKNGDRIRVRLLETVDSDGIVPVSMPLSILYEDEDILVVNKPADMPVHPSLGNYTNTLANGVAAYLETKGESCPFRCINRLDRDTSGALILAKNALSAAILSVQMRNRQISRTYLAVVEGIPRQSGTISAPISRAADSVIERRIDFENGESAITHYQLLEVKNNHSLLEIHLETGRTHQIRVHMSYIGHPLPADYLYNPVYDTFKRQPLHSLQLKFCHPITGTPMCLMAPVPEDMSNAF